MELENPMVGSKVMALGS